MSAESIAESIAEEQGWNDSTLLGLCLDYINNQQSDEAFEDHLRQNCADEDEDEDGPFKDPFLD
jgi:hypothetical protein